MGSASLEVSATGQIISYEEYYPYGTTAYQMKNADVNATAKRYRYTRKERDEETGRYYHGARYYIPWLAKWYAVDPLESKYSPQSSYVYCLNNPIALHDPDGKGHKNKTAPAKKEKTPEPQTQPELNSVLHMQSNLVASDQPTPGGSPRGNNIGSSHLSGTSLVEHAKSLIPRGLIRSRQNTF